MLVISSASQSETTTTNVSTSENCINLVPSVNITECQDSVAHGKTYKLIREIDKSQSYTSSSFERGSLQSEEDQSKPKEDDSFISAIGGTLWAFILGALGLGIYFVPVIVASNRGHNSGPGIFVLNLFLGWTLIGWVIALVWAITGGKGDSTCETNNYKYSSPLHNQNTHIRAQAIEIEQLSQLHKSGHITDKEFTAAKRKLLGL